MHRLVVATLLLVVLSGTRALADDRLGEPWEPGIAEGIARQEQDRKDKRPDTILRQAELLAARRTDPTTQVVRLYLLARAYGITGDLGSARTTYREVLQQARNCYFAYHDLAMLALQQRPADTRGAEQLLRQAIAAHPGYVIGYKKLASLLIENERPADAVGVLRRVVELDPTSLDARFMLTRTLLALDRLDEAERELVVLLRKDPKNAGFLELKAGLYTKRGRLDDAKRTYQTLADAYPSAPSPLQGYLRCLDLQRNQTPPVVDLEEWLWALERLYRVERDPARKEELRAAIERFRGIQAGGAEATPPEMPEGPPSDALIAQALDNAPPQNRVQLLRYVYARSEDLEPALLTALIRHLGPRVEPTAQVRQWVLRVLGRHGGFGLAGLLRHSLADPDASVRPVAVNALVELADKGAPAKAAALLTLGLYADSRDLALAGQARFAVLDLAKGRLPDPTEDTEAARRDAFLVWWTGGVANEAKIGALIEFPKVRDEFPEDILVPYLQDPDPFVARAAWQALTQALPPLLAAGKVDPARAAWFRRLPPAEAGALVGESAEATRRILDAWVAEKPAAR